MSEKLNDLEFCTAVWKHVIELDDYPTYHLWKWECPILGHAEHARTRRQARAMRRWYLDNRAELTALAALNLHDELHARIHKMWCQLCPDEVA